MDIRRALPEDLKQLEEIERTCFPEGRFSRTVLRRIVGAEEYLTLVASQEEDIVGYVSVFTEGPRWRLISIATRPDRQERDIGSAMLLAVKGRMIYHGVREMGLELRITNVPAFNLYLKFGFELSGVIKEYYNNGEDALHMTLKLE